MRAILFNDTSGSRHFGCEYVITNLVEQLQCRGISISWVNPVGLDWRGDNVMLPGVDEFDLVLVNGEGSIHHDTTRPRARWLGQVARWAKAQAKPAYLLNATLQQLSPDCLADISQFDKILVRESASLALLQQFGIAAELSGDLTLLTELSGIASTAANTSKTLVTDSVLPDSRVALRRFAARSGFQFRPMKPRQLEQINRQDFVAMITASDTVITGRFHTVTFCLLTGTPVLATESNTVKISATLKDALGHHDRIFQIEQLPSLPAMLPASYTLQEQQHLQNYLLQCRARWKTFFDDIAQP